jgi:hypothetical protein
MGNFGAFLIALAGPVARRVLLSLGLGVISYAGLALVAAEVKDYVIASYGGLSGSVLDLLNLIGFGQATGVILGAIIARAAFAAVSRIGVMSA